MWYITDMMSMKLSRRFQVTGNNRFLALMGMAMVVLPLLGLALAATVAMPASGPTMAAAAPAGDYLVVDVSEGPKATTYPVSHLAAIPAGGWTDEYKTIKMVFRRLPAGTFIMGSPNDRKIGRFNDETPQHQVTLSQDFYLGVFTVTQKQWERVIGTWPSAFNNPAFRDTRPVEKVNYNDIRGLDAGAKWPASEGVDETSFMGILRKRTGLAFDLPTEAQWEYACRAGTTTDLNSGYDLASAGQDAHMDQVGRYWFNGGSNYSLTTASQTSVDLSGGTAKVGSYQPNAWGLYDMHGNVWQLCLDWYSTGYRAGKTIDPKNQVPKHLW